MVVEEQQQLRRSSRGGGVEEDQSSSSSSSRSIVVVVVVVVVVEVLQQQLLLLLCCWIIVIHTGKALIDLSASSYSLFKDLASRDFKSNFSYVNCIISLPCILYLLFSFCFCIYALYLHISADILISRQTAEAPSKQRKINVLCFVAAYILFPFLHYEFFLKILYVTLFY